MGNITEMDALADVLNTIRLSAQTYFCTDFSAPWGMDIEQDPQTQGQQGMFHILVAGQCWLKTEHDSQPLLLKCGDIVAFPTGGYHWISDTRESPRLPGGQVVKQILSGNNPFQANPFLATPPQSGNCTLLCGSFNFDSSVQHPFVKELPCFIHIKASDSPGLEWLNALVTVLATESRQPSPGSRLMVDRLTEVLFIQLIRSYLQQHPEKMTYMAALADPQIGAALNQIHDDHRAYWTVERLGDSVALSRSAFNDKFSKMVGMPPKTYLVNWRMQKARVQLELTDGPMIDIAERAGYGSEAAFSKAFKQFFKLTPGQVRRGKSQD